MLGANSLTTKRGLIAIPAYNEEATIEKIVRRVRASLTEFDLLVVNDGSQDTTGLILNRLGVTTATHLCNLGYGRAIQTAIKYALEFEYELLITLDADGQHQPEQVRGLYQESIDAEWDVLIGSRYIQTRTYSNSPFGRRIGMQLFSVLVKLVTGRRIYDTTSGLKVIKRRVLDPLVRWHFADFHAEAIVYLLRLGYQVGEYPIIVAERTHGQSMYSALSHLKYPLKTSLMVILGLVEAELTRRRKYSDNTRHHPS
jgi:glycosyltransferase involved in cell wall biosynthesis